MYLMIKEKITHEIVVDKSRFIATLFPIQNLKEFQETLDEVKKTYYKADHHTYAYIIDEVEKGSDDREPKGSAGKNYLSFFKYQKLNYVGVIVTRFFGGKLLGAGNLSRTYLKALEETFKLAKTSQVIKAREYSVLVEYDLYDIFANYLKKYSFNVKDLAFNDKIRIVFIAPLEFEEDLESLFIKKVIIEKNLVINYIKEN
ncbi:MAG TPA: YigZ family protein [Candidatus Onthovivens sp.]|nr:YigZ family protein [Candidatus Onthovivens sp.]